MLGSSVFLRESAKLLAGENASVWDIDNMVAVLEDTSNPVTARQTERLFQSVISKAHVNFDDIPESVKWSHQSIWIFSWSSILAAALEFGKHTGRAFFRTIGAEKSGY